LCATCRVFNVGIDGSHCAFEFKMVAIVLSNSKCSEGGVWHRSNAFEEQQENCKLMERVVFTYAFNHQNCLTKSFMATDGFVLIPVTKGCRRKHERHEEKHRNLVRS